MQRWTFTAIVSSSLALAAAPATLAADDTPTHESIIKAYIASLKPVADALKAVVDDASALKAAAEIEKQTGTVHQLKKQADEVGPIKKEDLDKIKASLEKEMAEAAKRIQDEFKTFGDRVEQKAEPKLQLGLEAQMKIAEALKAYGQAMEALAKSMRDWDKK